MTTKNHIGDLVLVGDYADTPVFERDSDCGSHGAIKRAATRAGIVGASGIKAMPGLGGCWSITVLGRSYGGMYPILATGTFYVNLKA